MTLSFSVPFVLPSPLPIFSFPFRLSVTICTSRRPEVAFKVYDMDRDGFISNGELYLVLKQMVGNNLKVCPRYPLPL